MTAGNRQLDERMTVVLVFVTNLLPIAGLLLLNWRLPEALFAYWVDIALFTVLYTGLVLFAQQEPQSDKRTIELPAIPVPFVTGRSGSVRPIERLPPIFPRNVSYAVGILPFGLFFWFFTASLLFAYSDPDFRYDTAGTPGIPIEQQLSVITDAFTLEGLVVAAVLFGVRLVTVRRAFFGRRRYERVSAPTVAEIPFRIGIVWVLLVAMTAVTLPFVILPLLEGYGTAAVTEVWVATVAIVGKTLMEWAALHAHRPRKPDGLVRWLTPEELDEDA